MENGKIEDVLSNMSPSSKKELLDSLVNSLLRDLSEAKKKDLLQTILTGREKNRELAEMVEH